MPMYFNVTCNTQTTKVAAHTKTEAYDAWLRAHGEPGLPENHMGEWSIPEAVVVERILHVRTKGAEIIREASEADRELYNQLCKAEDVDFLEFDITVDGTAFGHPGQRVYVAG